MIDLKEYLNHMQVPDQFKQAYNRVVLAGMKVMFSPETHQLMLQQLSENASLPDRIGHGVADLLTILYKKSNATLPPQVIIPAGMNLCLQALDFVMRSGREKVDEKVVAATLETFIHVILESAGTNLDQVMQMLQQPQGQPQQQPAGVQ